MNSITSDENDTSDDNDLFVTVIQNTQQIYELWDRIWVEPEDDFKVIFLYHYFSLHLKYDLFYLIDEYGKSYPMTWDNPKFQISSVQMKIFTPQEAYSLSIKEMNNEILKYQRMIVGSRLIDGSGVAYSDPLCTLQFNYSITPIKIELSELYRIEEPTRRNYLIALSDKIYQKQAIPEELFRYINSTSKCQLLILTTINNINSIWIKIDRSMEAQKNHMNYITKLMHHIISQSVLTPLFNKTIFLVKLAFNILPLDYNEKIEFLETNIKNTQLEINKTMIP